MRNDFVSLKMSPACNGKRPESGAKKSVAGIDAFKGRPIRRLRDGSINTGFYIKRARNVRALSLRGMLRTLLVWMWGHN